MRTRFVLVLVALLLIAVPAHAAERIRHDQVPQVTWPATIKLRQVITHNGVPTTIFGTLVSNVDDQFAVRGWNIEFDEQGRPDLTQEVIFVGGRTYWRQQNETRWYMTSKVPIMPSPSLFDLDYPLKDTEHPSVLVSRVGDVTVDGVLTTQYQYAMPQSHLPGYLSSAKFDYFIGKANAAPIKWQWSMVDVRGDEPVLREWIVDAYDHGVPITIVAPPAELVIDMTADANARPDEDVGFFLQWLRSQQ
jgi:hypothetical protein